MVLSGNTAFYSAREAFLTVYRTLCEDGIEIGDGTKKLYNVGFYILNPQLRDINVDFRKWNEKYAEREWQWYLSEDRSVEELRKYAPIWDKMHNGSFIVNSNYGYQWNRNNQLEKIIDQLKKDPLNRQSFISIFDGKEKSFYDFDAPCTLAIGFLISENKLCMNAYMRSNDIWFGFCNDQYCFSKLQEYVAGELKLEIGWYYHHATDMHVYLDKINKHK